MSGEWSNRLATSYSKKEWLAVHIETRRSARHFQNHHGPVETVYEDELVDGWPCAAAGR